MGIRTIAAFFIGAAAANWAGPGLPASTASASFQDTRCSASLGGQVRGISGHVIAVADDWGLTMTIFDQSTNCRVAIMLDDSARPCAIRQSVRIAPASWHRAGQAELVHYDYLVRGVGTYTCG